MKYSSKLNEFDILDLLNEYQSEMRKLKHKMDFVKQKIADLESLYLSIKGKKTATAPVAETPEIEATESLPKEKKAATEPVKKARKPYPLSAWDQFILQAIEENGRATLSKDIYEKTKEKAIAAGIFEDEDKAKAKVNQCLVKLSNKRHDIRKVKHKGRGHAYALPVWFDERNRLIRAHALK